MTQMTKNIGRNETKLTHTMGPTHLGKASQIGNRLSWEGETRWVGDPAGMKTRWQGDPMARGPDGKGTVGKGTQWEGDPNGRGT